MGSNFLQDKDLILRKISMRFCLTFLLIITRSLLSQAQVDVSSQLLLRPSKSAPSQGMETGRYQVRGAPSTEMKIELKRDKKSKLPTKNIPSHETVNDSTFEQNNRIVVAVTTTTTTTTTTMAVTTTTTTLAPSPPEEPTVVEQVKELVSNNDQPLIEAYKEQIHPDDTRLNQLEIGILPGVIGDKSSSNYSFRSYNTFSPKISIDGKLWLTPFLGVYGNYMTSLGGDVSSDPGSNSHVLAQHEMTEFGFDLRRFFGMSRKSNSLQCGLFYSEYRFTVPGDDTHRVRLRSSGLGLRMFTRIPVAPGYSWIFGGKLIPRVQHQEQTTGISLYSGGSGESSRVDLSLGGEFKMTRQSQIIWELTVSHEKNQFTGEASHTDPETGQKPKGVSVNNTLTIFSFGYRWGQ